MNLELNKINSEIKVTWKKLIKFTISLIFIFLLSFYIFDLKEQNYKKEYESTTWYETKALYDYSYYHREEEKSGDDIKYIDYYDWYFKYTGRDGKTYNYIEKNNYFEPDVEFERAIYVDENDNSHALKIRSFESEYVNFAKKVAVLIIIIPFIIAYLIIFIILYIKRFIIKKKISKDCEYPFEI